jgi:putative ABC transport system permease protein
MAGNTVRYQLTADLAGGIRERQPTDGRPVPALVSPGLARAAGDDGILPVQVEGETIPVRVAGVVKRFPSVSDADVLVADLSTVANKLNAQSPGLGVTNEMWIDGNVPAQALQRSPFDVLHADSRAALEARLRADPLSRGALLTLAGTALVALLLAVVGLLLGLVADLRDETGELRDLEAQGATPAELRRHLRLRTLVVAAAGLVGGLVTGLVLSALVTDLVTLTANAGSPQPPLQLVFDVPLVLFGVLVYALLAWATVGLATHAAFRGKAVGRVSEAGV